MGKKKTIKDVLQDRLPTGGDDKKKRELEKMREIVHGILDEDGDLRFSATLGREEKRINTHLAGKPKKPRIVQGGGCSGK